MTRKRLVPCFLLLPSLAATLVGCTDSVALNPAPHGDAATDVEVADVSEDIVDDTQPDTSLDASTDSLGPIRRTVMTRSPFGNLSYTDNLLLDGDMEMSAGEGQTPWIAIDGFTQTPVSLETGGRCRSGLRCLRLGSGIAVLGQGVAAGDKPLEFWIWANVPSTNCNVAKVYLFPRMTMDIDDSYQVQADEGPDESGWCRFHTIRAPFDESIGVYVESTLPAIGFNQPSILLDDAVLRPADATSPTNLRSLRMNSTDHARISARLARIRRQQWLGAPPAARRHPLPLAD